MQQLSFYTIGEDFTRQLRDFISEGRLSTVKEILVDGGMPTEYIPKFFNFELKFEGDTRKGGLEIVSCDAQITVQQKYSCVCTMLLDYDFDVREFFRTKMWKSFEYLKVNDYEKLYNNLATFKEFWGFDEVSKFHVEKLRKNAWFDILYTPSEIKAHSKEVHSLSGVILQDGGFIPCGYMEHQSIYNELVDMEYTDINNWTECTKTIHISSNQMNGNLSYDLKHFDLEKGDTLLTKEMLKTLWVLADSLEFYGGFSDPVGECILGLNNMLGDGGGKFNNLAFLKEYMPWVKTPKVVLPKEGLTAKELQTALGEKYCLRSSPKHSMAGILESYFSEGGLYPKGVADMKSTFEKHKDLVKGNELNYFYQEFIEGQNGVCHYDENGFTYAISSDRGAIVEGKKSNSYLPRDCEKNLEAICVYLYERIGSMIQLEFALTDDEVLYILQLRSFDNKKQRVARSYNEARILAKGKTFSPTQKRTEVEKDNTLVATKDLPSSDLIGKDCLIVVGGSEFSHLLALSKSLNIPSILVETLPQLPERFEIDFSASEGFILKK